MTRSTTSPRPTPPPKSNRLRTLAVLAFWLTLWQTASMAIDERILLVSPIEVLITLFGLVRLASFWSSVAFSFGRIVLGFALGAAVGWLLAVLSSLLPLVRTLLSPLFTVIKATPVPSFTILALVWLPSRSLSVFIAFLMVAPILYLHLLAGLDSIDPQLAEMADVFRVPRLRRLTYIYLPHLLPFVRSAASVALGLCWKAGVAAEVIGLPSGSIGERLYQAKLYLSTAELFAWTLVVILLSMLLEHGVLFLLDFSARRLEGRL